MKHGFSLVELSIVLVILGLLTGGILTGQNLIRAAELRSITTEYQAYKTAIHTFRDKYFAIPGDMINAEDFWTAAVVTNGDGDSVLDNPPAAANADGEIFAFFEHLSQAGLIEGAYDGLAGANASGMEAIPGDNVPRAKIGGGWSVVNLGAPDETATDYYEGVYNNVFMLGSATAADITTGVLISPEEAWNLDTKIDDGRPGIGILRIPESQGEDDLSRCSDLDANSTAANTDAVDADYALVNTSEACTLILNAN